jgi:hypothetical protein
MSAAATRTTVAILCCLALTASTRPLGAQESRHLPMPARISDAEFWKMVTDVSEPGGSFPSDNFTSNEMGFPQVIAAMHAANTTGGAYLGVGPEQNFSYITGIRPQIAFIVDIRRQAVMQHLMYKAIFELASDRADFVSLLFSKPRPAGLDANSTIEQIWEKYWFVDTDTTVYPKNVKRIVDHLTKTHGFGLDSNDVKSLSAVYEAFYRLGPTISYGGYGGRGLVTLSSTSPGSGLVTVRLNNGVIVNGATTGTVVGGVASGGGAASTAGGAGAGTGAAGGTVAGVTMYPFPASGTGSVVMTSQSPATSSITSFYGGINFAALSASVDAMGITRSFLSSEDHYRFMKDLETKNLLIPVVGDFAGPKAIRGVGQYLRDHDATITAFYTSNVEQYLFSNNVWSAFYDNVATLPVTPASAFIRSGSSLCPISAFLAAYTAGRVLRYADAQRCAQ